MKNPRTCLIAMHIIRVFEQIQTQQSSPVVIFAPRPINLIRTAAHKMYSNLMTIPPRARSPVFRGNPRRTVRMNALEAAMIARDLNLEGPDLSDPQYRRWLAEQEANEERDVQLEIELEFGPQQPLAADLSDLETASSGKLFSSRG